MHWLLQPLALLVCATLLVVADFDFGAPAAAAPEDFTADPELDADFPAATDVAMAPTTKLVRACTTQNRICPGLCCSARAPHEKQETSLHH